VKNIWPDSPIRSQAEDQFNRTPYAVQAAELIANAHTWDESVVFGLTGAWGAGKTSMLAMIEEELRRNHKQWRVARFSPWATGSVDGLLGDFFTTLTGHLRLTSDCTSRQ
jgi:predicted KAP-like P-loop ATPase